MRRFGLGLLWAGGFGLAALMAYTLALDTGPGWPHVSTGHDPDLAEVAVYYPERVLWQEFRSAVRLCTRKGLAQEVEESETSVVISTPRHKRLIRFDFHDVRGLREMKDDVQRLLGRTPQPVAIVGSSNTVLTRAIAEALKAYAGPQGEKGPVLLVPWASAVLADRPEPGEGPVALLDILPGRTFRFCPNNQYEADLVVQCLTAGDAKLTPRRAVLLVNRRDPYSVDLAACFHRAVEAAAPQAEIVELADPLSLPILHNPAMLPGPEEEALAQSIWRDAENAPGLGTTWVVLPLQPVPTQRMITALGRHGRRGLRSGEGPLRVVCGDGIGFSVLAPLAGRCAFPVWCSSSASAPSAVLALGQGLSPDTQVQAEIVSALIRCLDRAAERVGESDRLRKDLAALRLDAASPAAMGRSLAFSRSGERLGDDLGNALMIRPDRPAVYAISRKPGGRWSEPVRLEFSPVVLKP